MTKPPIHFHAATDTLGWGAPLTETACFPLLGVPVELRSNSSSVIDAAERAFGAWQDLEQDLIAPGPPLRIDLIVHAGTQETRHTPFSVRFHGSRLIAAGGASMMVAQIDRGEALAFVTPELVADEAHFRYNVLDQLALILASYRDRTPLHTGAIVRNGRAVLIAGPSLSGKSTLCYAAVRAGFQLLAEDVIYVGLSPRLRLWGNPGAIHLMPDATRYFPELADAQPQVRANGKLKVAVDAAGLGANRRRLWAERVVVCVIDRQDVARSTLEIVEPRVLVDAIAARPEAGFDLHPNLAEVAATVAATGVYRLVVGRDPVEAIAHLEELTNH